MWQIVNVVQLEAAGRPTSRSAVILYCTCTHTAISQLSINSDIAIRLDSVIELIAALCNSREWTMREFNKKLSYRRVTALQGGLVMAKNETLELGDNISWHYRHIFNHCDVFGQKSNQIRWKKNAK